MSDNKNEVLDLYKDLQKLSRQEIDPDDFIDRHPEAMNNRNVLRKIAWDYNKGGRKKFSWRNARHNYYKED